jgi:hypothetical protein
VWVSLFLCDALNVMAGSIQNWRFWLATRRQISFADLFAKRHRTKVFIHCGGWHITGSQMEIKLVIGNDRRRAFVVGDRPRTNAPWNRDWSNLIWFHDYNILSRRSVRSAVSLTTDHFALNYIVSVAPLSAAAPWPKCAVWSCQLSKGDRLAFNLKSQSAESSELPRASLHSMPSRGESKFPENSCWMTGEFTKDDQRISNSPC